MCGIWGIINTKKSRFNKQLFNILGTHNDSRGGDSCGIFIDGNAEYGIDTLKLYSKFLKTSNILKTMEQNGFITRQSVENDARLKKIILTDKAVKIHEEIMKDIERREALLRKGFTNSEIEQFLGMIDRFINNLEDEND